MKIFLIGFMGCGKTTLGKKLAAKLGYSLIDLDHQIEKITGTTVAAYFSSHGEEIFRKLERNTLQTHPYAEQTVISTGGGTPCYEDNMDWMNANGITIYIELPPASLAKRLEKGIEKRPLLRNLAEADLVSFIANKLEERSAFYRQATLILSGVNLTAEQLRQEIENRLNCPL